MNVNIDDLEVIGFNGTPRVECGRDLAIVHQLSSDHYYRLDGSAPFVYHSAEEIAAFEQQGRLTRFPHSIPLSQIAPFYRVGIRMAEVVWVRDSLLKQLGVSDPQKYPGVLHNWQLLNSSCRATCASGSGSRGLLNLWGRELLRQSDNFRTVAASDKWVEVKRLSDLGLCASIDPRLRFEHYRRYTAAQQMISGSAHARRTFDYLVKPEFKDVSWSNFEFSINDLIRERRQEMSIQEKWKGIAQVRPGLVMVG
jgi:hypothetical protein